MREEIQQVIDAASTATPATIKPEPAAASTSTSTGGYALNVGSTSTVER